MVYACKEGQSLSDRELEAAARVKRTRRSTDLFKIERDATMKRGTQAQNSTPNCAVKRPPTLVMASPFLRPLVVPSALAGSGAAYLGS